VNLEAIILEMCSGGEGFFKKSVTQRSNMANAISWFEIPVRNLERAVQFYSNVFNITFDTTEMGPIQLAMVAGSDQDRYGANGALVKGEEYVPTTSGTLVYFACDDVEVTLKKAEKAGGKTLVPKTSIGEYGFFAHFLDTEGNRVAMHSMK
jgi:hypothetical protein